MRLDMLNKIPYIFKCNKNKGIIMSNLKNNFEKILAVVKDSLKDYLNSEGNLPKRGPQPRFSDAEVMAIALLLECQMFDSEYYFFKKLNIHYKKDFPNLIERSRFNRRRKLLLPIIQVLQKQLSSQLTEGENTFIIDSMPIPVCKFSRAKRVRICRENPDKAPNYGICSSQGQTYYGYKLHGVCTSNGVITHFDLSPANMHDIEFLKDIKPFYYGCILLGDKAYLSDPLQLELFRDRKLLLHSPMRANQKNYRKQPAIFKKIRKRIETVFSQFCDQFRIQKNYAKTFWGFTTRIVCKITGFTLIQFLNKYSFKQPLNRVKHVLV